MDDRKFLWLHIVLISYLINFTAILLNRIVLDVQMAKENILYFMVLSAVISVMLVFGYFGMKVFAKVYIAFNLVAIVNLMMIAVLKTSEHWSDLTSLISYLFFIMLGLFVGLLSQVIHYARKNNDKMINNEIINSMELEKEIDELFKDVEIVTEEPLIKEVVKPRKPRTMKKKVQPKRAKPKKTIPKKSVKKTTTKKSAKKVKSN